MSDDLERAHAAREARKERVKAEADAQKVKDLEAVDEIEIEHGDSNVATLDVPFDARNPMPTIVAARTPRPAEIKRYRARVRPDADGRLGDTAMAAEELAAVVLLYPDAETFAKICEARPGVKAQLGLLSLRLASGKAQDEGKG